MAANSTDPCASCGANFLGDRCQCGFVCACPCGKTPRTSMRRGIKTYFSASCRGRVFYRHKTIRPASFVAFIAAASDDVLAEIDAEIRERSPAERYTLKQRLAGRAAACGRVLRGGRLQPVDPKGRFTKAGE